MKYALVNPRWIFEHSIYFGCREPHLPLELGYAKQLLEAAGHEVLLVDGHLERLPREEIAHRVGVFAPDFTVIPTAPSYLFWRCPPPELRVPLEAVRDLRPAGGTLVAVGPHGSTTPVAVLRKLRVDVVVMGEPEEVLPKLASSRRGPWPGVEAIAYLEDDVLRVQGGPHASALDRLPALRWPRQAVARHDHHHHRFDADPTGPGAEVEASRGCPFHCTFCAKDNFRDDYRRRPLPVVLEEIDALIAQGVEYVYFIDEIFLPDRQLLEALTRRRVSFGVQTRIDLWSDALVELLGRAGCRSIEAGVESISSAGRAAMAKQCRLDTDALTEKLVRARRSVPFVQASLIATPEDDPRAVEAWRQQLIERGVWANRPVPMFPYPGSPGYVRRWGAPDEHAWERAHAQYLEQFNQFSDIQDSYPWSLAHLEQEAS